MKLNEFDIYGSKRIGVIDTNLVVYEPSRFSMYFGPPILLDTSRTYYLEGQHRYELTNHLGNVLVTVSDRKYAIDPSHSGFAEYYLPNIVNAQDYYPFGMVEPGRNYIGYKDSSYRFGFNGKLYDDDIYGKDNSYDYGARFYDPRLGRPLSIDPLFKKFPMLSPFQFFSNNPILNIDLDGMEGDDYLNWLYNQPPKSISTKDIESTGVALSYAGDAMMIAGAGLSATGLGASLGVPLFAAGEYLNVTGSAIEFSGQMAQGNYGQAGITAIMGIGGTLGGTALLKAVKAAPLSFEGQMLKLNIEGSSLLTAKGADAVVNNYTNCSNQPAINNVSKDNNSTVAVPQGTTDNNSSPIQNQGTPLLDNNTINGPFVAASSNSPNNKKSNHENPAKNNAQSSSNPNNSKNSSSNTTSNSGGKCEIADW